MSERWPKWTPRLKGVQNGDSHCQTFSKKYPDEYPEFRNYELMV